MNRSRCFVIAILLISAASGVVAAPPDNIMLPPQPLIKGALVANEQGYIVENPVQIAGPEVSDVLISPDGRYILTVGRSRPDMAVATVRGVASSTGEEQISV